MKVERILTALDSPRFFECMCWFGMGMLFGMIVFGLAVK